ncbi:MAG: helix-turn-helix transcriptional regulator [Bacteroidales bacterium]|nr:helix-turn-helix transcriptional regulator [Bacteroidales bacterium]
MSGLYEGEIIKIYPETDVRAYKNWIMDEGFMCKVYFDHIKVGPRFKHKKFEPGELAGLIRKKRNVKGWNRYKLARVMGVREDTVFNWEIGRTQPKPERLEELMKVLEISHDELERCRK